MKCKRRGVDRGTSTTAPSCVNAGFKTREAAKSRARDANGGNRRIAIIFEKSTTFV